MIDQKKFIIRCDCGHPCFIEFSHWKDEPRDIWISAYDQPSTFWHWIKQLFKGRVYHAEALIPREDIKALIEFIDKYGGEHAKQSPKKVSSRKEKTASKKG